MYFRSRKNFKKTLALHLHSSVKEAGNVILHRKPQGYSARAVLELFFVGGFVVRDEIEPNVQERTGMDKNGHKGTKRDKKYKKRQSGTKIDKNGQEWSIID